MLTLQPGDALLFRPTDWLGRIICIKTWSPYSHVETYLGDGVSIAARKTGVRRYPLRITDAALIVRPDPARLRMVDGLAWFATVDGQAYDFLGLLRFFAWGRQDQTRQFCSELCTRFYRHAGFPDLFGDTDADLVPPGYFATLAGFQVVWSAK